jgi:hypothetical protein
MAFIAVVAVSVVAFALLGGVGLAQSAVGLVQYQYGKKVTICHKGKTIKISARAWSAHKRHGDEVGTCAALKKKHAKAEARANAAAAKGKSGKHGKEGGHGKKSEPSSEPVAETTSDAGKGPGNKGQSGKGGGSNGKSQGGNHDD